MEYTTNNYFAATVEGDRCNHLLLREEYLDKLDWIKPEPKISREATEKILSWIKAQDWEYHSSNREIIEQTKIFLDSMVED